MHFAGFCRRSLPDAPAELRNTRGSRVHHKGGSVPNVRLSLLGLAAGTVLLMGCTSAREWWCNGLKVGPNYRRPPAPVADRWIDADNPHVRSEATDYSYWWTEFKDPVLNELVYTAYEQNLPLKVAGLRILEARARRGFAVGELFPQTQEMTGAYNRITTSSNTRFGPFQSPKVYLQRWSTGFDAAWELDFWGRFRRLIEAADANLNVQIEDYDDVLVILQADVAATYIEIRTLQQRLAFARTNLDLQKETLKITSERQRIGVVTKLDVDQAMAQVAITESAIPLLEKSLRQAENRLCILLGIPPQQLPPEIAEPRPIPQTPAEVVVGIPAELLRRRPDVRRAERLAAYESALIGFETSDLYPQIFITGNIGVESQKLSSLFELNSIAGSIGPSLRWNILNYGRILNKIRIQDALFRQRVVEYQDAVLRANEEVENAIVAFLYDRERLEPLRVGVEASDSAAKLSMIQYKGGILDFQRVLDSQRTLVTEQDRLAEGRGNAALSLIAVYKALGGGWRMRYGPPAAEVGYVETVPQAGPPPGDAMPPQPNDGPFEPIPAPNDVPMPPEPLP